MKNLHLLLSNTMLNISERWLTDEGFCEALESAGPLGVGIHQALVKAHDPLAELHRARNQASSALRTLIDLASQLDARHDSKARGLNSILRGLADSADSPAEAARFRELEALLFPEGLSVTRLPYIQEGGAAVALERMLSAELRAELAEVPVGSRTLEQLLADWLEAGHQLGEVMQQRAELKAVLANEGDGGQLSIRAARTGWLKAVRALLWAIDLQPELHGLRDRVEGVLQAGIAGELGRGVDAGELGGDELEDAELGDDELGDEELGDAELGDDELIAS